MYAHVTMAFLETVVLSDIVEIIPTYYNGPLHLHLLHDASENASPDRNVASEWAFLVNVSSFESLRVNIQVEMAYSCYYIRVSKRLLTSRGVLNPRPTLRLYLMGFLLFGPRPFFRLRKIVGCFWNARSVYKYKEQFWVRNIIFANIKCCY